MMEWLCVLKWNVISCALWVVKALLGDKICCVWSWVHQGADSLHFLVWLIEWPWDIWSRTTIKKWVNCDTNRQAQTIKESLDFE